MNLNGHVYCYLSSLCMSLAISYIYLFSSTPKSSSADSGVDNPGFRIENEGLGYVDINEMTSNGTINKEENGVTSTDGNEKFSNMAGVRLTSPTNAAIQPEHPDSTVWIKSPFGKKYKTQQSDGKGNKARFECRARGGFFDSCLSQTVSFYLILFYRYWRNSSEWYNWTIQRL